MVQSVPGLIRIHSDKQVTTCFDLSTRLHFAATSLTQKQQIQLIRQRRWTTERTDLK